MAKFKATTETGKSFFIDDANEIHRGGEGRIILLPKEKNKVAKIYHNGVIPISKLRFEQLQKLDNKVFVKPLNLLFSNNEIIGFTMEYAGSDYFPISSLFNRSFCQRNGISDKFKTTIANNLIEAVKQAHFNGFVIGDLNQYNVLVNNKCDIKLIDVDSYETPGHKHTGILLDEIRDYYYKGIVSMNSDYFALSVLLFYLLTYTHPFKGVHEKYKSLAERMIKQLPVFVNDCLLKVPKCFEPIQDKSIQGKFEKMYINGERFLFSLNGTVVQSKVKKPLLVAKHDEKDLVLSMIFQGVEVLDVYFSLNQGFIETKSDFTVFNSTNKSYLNKKTEISKGDFEKLYLGNETILGRIGNELFHVKKNEVIKIDNFKFPQNSFCYQLENVLIVIARGQMYWLYLDEVFNHSIRNKRTEVFSEAMSHHNGLIQNTGGVQRVFYHTGIDIATVKVGKTLKQVFQQGNIGLTQFIENNKLVNQYFKIEGLKLEFVDYQPKSFVEYAYMKTDKKSGFIFEPTDNKLSIRRTEDFKLVSEIECSKISEQSTLFYANSGIIVWEGNEVFLVNKK